MIAFEQLANAGLVPCAFPDVEEDGGGGVKDVRGEAPDEPRPAHQRHGLIRPFGHASWPGLLMIELFCST